jgi:hypothetical protein
MDKVTYQLGVFLSDAVVVPIFWGTEWDDPANKSTANQFVDDLSRLLLGPYMRALSQYGGIRPATVVSPVFDSSQPTPKVIDDQLVSAYVSDLIASGKVLDFRQNLQLIYFVFTLGREWVNPDEGGFHGAGQINNQSFYWAWAQDPIPETASHEIVEACTNPEGTGFFQKVGPIEVADICLSSLFSLGRSDGIASAPYWSNIDNSCVQPHRTAHISIAGSRFAECRIGPSVGFRSTFVFSYGVYPDWIDSLNLPQLTNPKYQWSFDESIATAITPDNQESLELQFTAQPAHSSIVGLVITADHGIKVTGSLKFRVNSETEAQLLLRICRFRKLINERMLPNWPINPLSPDSPEIPTERDIVFLNSFAKRFTYEVEQITALSRKIDGK